ncbi:MAG: alpha/beta fold hydrolase [Deltaproteobacteria bacterium]
MTLALSVALGLALFVAASLAHYVFWTRRLTVPREYASRERLPTADGALIELHRLPGPVATASTPVLLVHGVGIDHRNNDMLPQVSLARHLREAGRDVWLLRLRSGGLWRVFGDTKKVRFARMAEHDLPLAVRAVLDRTGASSLDYVGFSMGGMLAYAAIGAHRIDPALLRRVVIIGSPARVGHYVPLRHFLTRIPAPLVPPLPLRLGSRMVAFAAEWVRTPLHHLLYNPDNVERGLAGPAMMTVEDIPGPLNVDFLSFIRRGVVHFEGKDVLEGLRHVTIPVLFFAGARDRLSPPEAVRIAYDAWGAEAGVAVDKRFVLLARGEEASADYGHGDLAIGRAAKADLFEPIERFLGGGI